MVANPFSGANTESKGGGSDLPPCAAVPSAINGETLPRRHLSLTPDFFSNIFLDKQIDRTQQTGERREISHLYTIDIYFGLLMVKTIVVLIR